MNKNALGLLQVYTGPGKGKTTAAVGLAVRAAGQGLRVAFIQFAKPEESGEVSCLQKLGVVCLRFGADGWVSDDGCNSAHKEAALQAWRAALSYLTGKEEVNILILDELNVTVALGLLDIADVLARIINRPHGLEVVCTGRNAPQELTRAADLITEMKEVKHYYQQGLGARKGIEF